MFVQESDNYIKDKSVSIGDFCYTLERQIWILILISQKKSTYYNA